MKILAIETSCDDTAVSVVEVKGSLARPVFRVLAHNIASQTDTHQAWGGIVPSLAKREHGRNLMPVFIKSLHDAFGKQAPRTVLERPPKGLSSGQPNISNDLVKKIVKILAREPELREQFMSIIPTLKTPKIDLIAVTRGPGLEPALWVGINFARALALVWDKPLQAVNHLEGHILAVLENMAKTKIVFPVVALIASGGHTELVLSTDWLKYKVVGQTRDDAVGEAFDKVARLLGLPYPGGPAIAELALKASGQSDQGESSVNLPRPMLKSGDFDFSFSGLKTAVLYLVQKMIKAGKFDEASKAAIAADFQAAAVEVLTAKTFAAARKFKARTVIAGGGVIANRALRQALATAATRENLTLLIPDLVYTTDNATMIGLASGLRHLANKSSASTGARALKADGNWQLG